MKQKIVPFMLTLVFLVGCSNDSEDDLINTQPPPAQVTYTNDIKSIIDNNCIVCHSNPPVNGANTSLVTFDDVRNGVVNNNLIGKLQGTAPGAQMPLGSAPLPQNLIDLVIQWQADGLIE